MNMNKMQGPVSNAAELAQGSAGTASLESDFRACHASPGALRVFIARLQSLSIAAQRRGDGTALERCNLFLDRAQKVLNRRERAPLEVKAR